VTDAIPGNFLEAGKSTMFSVIGIAPNGRPGAMFRAKWRWSHRDVSGSYPIS
jgi:hypothetical protein